MKVQNVLAMETKMVNGCLDVSTLPAVINIVQELMITKIYPFILSHNDFEAFLKNKSVEDLKRLAGLTSKVNDADLDK